jgi:glutathione peroxidase
MRNFVILVSILAVCAGCNSGEKAEVQPDQQNTSTPATDASTTSNETGSADTDTSNTEKKADTMTEQTAAKGPLSFTMTDIDGNEVDLSKYQGKVVLMVNVASKCGLTPQYEALEALNKKYSKQGLAILGFPANNFLGQEPGTNKEIKEFCTSKYGVDFDMFAKISVNGADQHPLYAYLTSKEAGHDFGGEIEWNFAKFLVGRDGQIIARFSSRTSPSDPEVTSKIEQALGAGA